MDYEKAYKESFEAAKGLHEAGNALTKKQMEIVFPQLAESEDEKIRRTLVEYFGPEVQLDFVRGVPIRKIRDWLEKQKEQKPANATQTIANENANAEWSEEDEDMLNSCISSIEEAKENRYAYKETDGDTSYDHEIAWLKSLRPQSHWKPSEEQMKALLGAEGISRASGYPDNAKVLASLYEQIKKL